MNPKMTDCGPPIASADVEAFEREIGYTLPEDYRAFLLKFNGGKPEPDTIDIPKEGIVASDISSFHGLVEKPNYNSLLRQWRGSSKNRDKHMLPIAGDAGGCTYYLSLDGDDRGVVYFWDYYGKGDDPTCAYPNCCRLADTFTQFVDLIRGPNEAELAEMPKLMPWEEAIRDNDVAHIERMIASGAHLSERVGKRTVLETAAMKGRLEIVKRLIEAGSPQDRSLQFACAAGHEEVVVFLIELGFPLIDECVFSAAMGGRLNVLKRLIAAGGNVNAKRHGNPAIKAARMQEHDEIVEVLLAAGAEDVPFSPPDY